MATATIKRAVSNAAINQGSSFFFSFGARARCDPDLATRPEPGEVDEVFSAPLAHVTTPANFRIEGRRWRGVRRHYYTVPWGPYYIWGATARMLRGLAERMQA